VHRQRLNNRLRLSINDSIPLSLRINSGVGDSRLSLSSLKVSKIDFESGVGEAKISAYEPNSVPCEFIKMKNGVGRLEAVGLGNLNFRELEFEGGVGGANLDFTGEWKQNASIKITVGVGGVNVSMPRDIGVRVEAEKHLLSGLHLEGFTMRDSYYYSENYDQAAIRVSVRVTTGIGGLRIAWV
jgi:predicted membrane protein